MERVVGRGVRAELWLWPIDAASIGKGTVVVHAVDRAWSLVSRDSRVANHDSLVLPLASAHFRWRSARVRHRPTVPLVLTAPTGIGDLRLFPVVDIGPHHCAVDSPVAFPTNELFPSVELVGDRGILRRTAVRVLENIPWVTGTGHRGYRVRLRFVDGIAHAEPEYDLVDEPDSIRRLLELATLLDLPCTVDGGPVFRFSELHDTELCVTSDVQVVGATRRTLTFDLFAVSYECVVRLLGNRGGVTRFSLPLLLRRRRRRFEPRTPVRADVQLSFWNPATGMPARRRVVDLSMGGVCCEVRDEDVLWPFLPLERAELEFEQETVAVGDVIVRSLDRRRCHLSFENPTLRRNDGLGRLLAALRRPELRIHDGKDLDPQLDLYRGVHLVTPYMEQQLAAAGEGFRRSWQSAHESGSVCRTLTRTEDGRTVASVTALMAWDGTWLGQHLAARKNRLGCTPGTLLLAFLDHVLLRDDCRQMAFFSTVSNKKMNAIHERFQSLTGTAEAVARTRVRAFLLRGATSRVGDEADENRDVPTNAQKALTVRRLRPRDRTVIHRAARRQLGTLVANALAFDAGSLTLPIVRPLFRQNRLVRRRNIFLVSDGLLRVAAVTERTSPGLCIPGILNATWLIPVHLEIEDATGARQPSRLAIERAVDMLELEQDEPSRLVIVDESVEPSWLTDLGLEPAFDAYVYVLNRAGLHRYAMFLAESYGEFNAGGSPRAASG